MMRLVLSLIFSLCYFTRYVEAKIPELQDLSLEAKVGQLLLVHFHGHQPNHDAQVLIEKAHVGGFIYYTWANELSSPAQVQALSLGLQDLAKKHSHVPLFIATDQEGGVVSRLKKGFTIFPGNYAVAQTKQPDLAYIVAFVMGQEMRAVGINMNLAPVVDVNANPLNPVIGTRAFGQRPEQVIEFAQKALEGYHKASMITVLKHFPGHGDVTVDSHHSLPTIFKTREELDRMELLPFRQLAPQTDAIMTAHLLVPALDSERCATLSPYVVDKLLRKEMKFKGVILTDSLMMQGLLNDCPCLEEAAIHSLNAGHDLILLGGRLLSSCQEGKEITVAEVLAIHQAIVQAVNQGRLSKDRLDASVQKILDLKSAYQVGEETLSFSPIERYVRTPLHQQLAEKVADAALVSESTHR